MSGRPKTPASGFAVTYRGKRLLDITLALLGCAAMALPMWLIALAIKLDSPGPVLHWSKRVGINNRLFLMPKFRTMRANTPQLATHLFSDARQFLTPIGGILRKTSLDELPQLWSVLRGDMSLVGPRPALFNQDDLVALRSAKGVERLIPGITGWAQVNGRDELPIPVKVEYDAEYLQRISWRLDLKILALTVRKAFKGDGVSH